MKRLSKGFPLYVVSKNSCDDFLNPTAYMYQMPYDKKTMKHYIDSKELIYIGSTNTSTPSKYSKELKYFRENNIHYEYIKKIDVDPKDILDYRLDPKEAFSLIRNKVNKDDIKDAIKEVWYYLDGRYNDSDIEVGDIESIDEAFELISFLKAQEKYPNNLEQELNVQGRFAYCLGFKGFVSNVQVIDTSKPPLVYIYINVQAYNLEDIDSYIYREKE